MAKHEQFVEESSATPSCTYRHSGTFANYKNPKSKNSKYDPISITIDQFGTGTFD